MRMKKLIVTLGVAGLVAAAAAPVSANPAASPMSAVSVSSASVSSDCFPVARERRDASGLIWYEYDYVCI